MYVYGQNRYFANTQIHLTINKKTISLGRTRQSAKALFSTHSVIKTPHGQKLVENVKYLPRPKAREIKNC